MTTFTGSLTAVASTTVAATTIRTQMQTTIPLNSAWSLVESTTMNVGAIPCDVYKCAAAGSGLSADFYVGVMQSGAALYFGLAEGYNASTHKPRRPAMVATSALQTLQADGGLMPSTQELDWYNGTYNPGGGALNVPVTGGMSLLPSVTDDYMIAVAKDAVYLLIRTASKFLYAGAYDTNVPTPATNDPLPIVTGCGSASGTAATYATRLPLSGSASRGWACNVNGKTSGDLGSGNSLNQSTSVDSVWASFPQSVLGGTAADQYDKYWQPAGVQAFRVTLFNSYTQNSATLGRDLNGWIRGWVRHIRYIQLVATASTMDTCTVDGVGYTFTNGTTAAGFWVETNPT